MYIPLIDLVVVVIVVNDVLVVDVIVVDRVVGVFIASNIPVPENIPIWAVTKHFHEKRIPNFYAFLTNLTVAIAKNTHIEIMKKRTRVVIGQIIHENSEFVFRKHRYLSNFKFRFVSKVKTLWEGHKIGKNLPLVLTFTQ